MPNNLNKRLKNGRKSIKNTAKGEQIAMEEAKSKAKSNRKTMKTAFIRVSAVNETKDNGIVKYSYDEFKHIIAEWSQSLAFTYYAIEHNGEAGDESRHYHAVLVFPKGSAAHFDTVKGKFPYGNIQPCRNVKQCVQYLVHLNDLSKQTYEWSEIYTNDTNLDKYKVMSASTIDIKTKRYIDLIMLGEIKEYNFADTIEPEIFAKRRTQLMNALELYRMKLSADKNRKIKVIVCQGDTGTGKTTWAKQWAKTQGKSYCVSSTSNDPWQDYKGEDVLILDELRSSVFALEDLLKIIDNHTKSSSQSRFHNKLFLGDTIIITTNEEWQDWYKWNKDDKSRNALMRRASLYMKFSRTKTPYVSIVEIFSWDIDKLRYERIGTKKFYYREYIDTTERDNTEFDILFD